LGASPALPTEALRKRGRAFGYTPSPCVVLAAVGCRLNPSRGYSSSIQHCISRFAQVKALFLFCFLLFALMQKEAKRSRLTGNSLKSTQASVRAIRAVRETSRACYPHSRIAYAGLRYKSPLDFLRNFRKAGRAPCYGLWPESNQKTFRLENHSAR
jgi:hypothetical protein